MEMDVVILKFFFLLIDIINCHVCCEPFLYDAISTV